MFGLFQIQMIGENIVGYKEENHSGNNSVQGGIGHVSIEKEVHGAHKNTAVSRCNQHDDVKNLAEHVDSNIGKDGSQNPMIFPQLSQCNAGKEHERAVEQLNDSVDRRIEAVTAKGRIHGMEKGSEDIHNRYFF